MGLFLNTTNGSADHIDNMDGEQGAYLFALPDLSIFQDDNTFTGTNAPNHNFQARFEAGKSYALTVGLLGGGGGMTNGATYEISLYYRDASSNAITVVARSITNSSDLFPTNTHLTDFQVILPTVKASDAWAGKNIGIRLASTVGFDLQGGYWDLDNVRLTESLVPNNSFESPQTLLATPSIDEWQKVPEPVWYNGGGGFPWEQTMGLFLNTTNGSADHIDNMDGEQGAYLFALPDLSIFQDDNTFTGTNAPNHNFQARFETGKSYALTVGLLGGGGGMTNGATFEISFYYRDVSSNAITVAATSITNSSDLFPTNTHLTDFQVILPTVKASDAWAGKNIGIRLASTVGFDLQGGYWDLDNVRLTVVADPVLKNIEVSGEQTQFEIDSEPGRYEILAGTDLTLPLSAWTSLGVITNVSGNFSFTDVSVNPGNRFYQVRQSP